MLWSSVYFAAGLVITLSILIFVHELGHFLAAKRTGVRVEKFSIGFGPRLLGFRKGETEYVVSAIPFGGYVRMAGEDPEAPAAGGDWEFLAKNKKTRALIIVAGPAMNILLSIVIIAFIAGFQGIETVGPVLEITVDKGSPADSAGFRERDLIVTVGGDSVVTWTELDRLLVAGMGTQLEIAYERAGHPGTTWVDLGDTKSISDVGIGVFYEPMIGDVAWRGPAYSAGLRGGDKVVDIDGEPITSWDGLRQRVLASPGQEMVFTWERGSQRMSSTVVPKHRGEYGVIEATPWLETARSSLLGSIASGVEVTMWAAGQITQITKFFGELLQGRATTEAVGGPIRIGQIAGDALRWGISNFLWFLALISAQLAILNLVPVPVLDGGHLLLLGIETLTRKPITTRQRVIAHQIGFAFLFSLMILVTLFDISRFFGR